MLKQVSEFVEKGLCSWEDFRCASRNGNFDEVGLNPSGNSTAVVSLKDEDRSCFRPRAVRAVSSEKAAFWTTLGICTIADGTLLPFMVIHESSSEGTLTADKFENLPEDFLVSSSSAGYNTRQDFSKFVKWFCK